MHVLAQAAAISLAIVNARVWTGDTRRPWADAVAVQGNQIAAVGSSAEIRKLAGAATRVIDAKGAMVVPGFTDAHVHFIDGGFALQSVKLRDAKTKAEFIRRIGAFARTVPAGAWILNGDWDHENWGGELPTRQWIDSVTPEQSRLDQPARRAHESRQQRRARRRARHARREGRERRYHRARRDG